MVVLRKLTARVFGAAPGLGGNPLTIFASTSDGSSTGIPAALEKSLAKSCEWESVFIHGSPGADSGVRLKFFAPSGVELSLCAHAAMGASYAIHKSGNSSTPATISFQTSDDSHQTAHVDGDQVLLDLRDVTYEESYLPLVNADSLLDQVGVEMIHVLSLPINLAIAGRPKSAIQLPLQVLQEVVKNPYAPKLFQNNCMFAGETSGLYLYSPVGSNWSADVDELGRYECRQFPRKSGYPEDPATGIAAAALAVYLSRRHHLAPTRPDDGVWKFRQGTAMARPSIITIQNIDDDKENNTVSLQCGGRVEIDSEEEMQV
ncbi:Phenazine biosynthesis-like protein [Fragilaria crotonensis]|nr:Phenazine biosynthesis-like protein [Fragilaria crotonensis]